MGSFIKFVPTTLEIRDKAGNILHSKEYTEKDLEQIRKLWLLYDSLNDAERIITEFKRNNEPINIVVDEKFNFLRMLKRH